MTETYLIAQYLRMMYEPIARDRIVNGALYGTMYLPIEQTEVHEALCRRLRALGGDPIYFWNMIQREQQAIYDWENENE